MKYVNKKGIEKEVVVDRIKGRHDGIAIEWHGSIGFGEYTIYQDEDGNLIADSECLDSNEDKAFLKALFSDIVEKLEIAQ